MTRLSAALAARYDDLNPSTEPPKKRSKYGNKRISEDGYIFDSRAECKRYRELKLLQTQGQIAGLVVHPTYELQPAFTSTFDGKQRAIVYEADFSYIESGKTIVEDVKGVQTADFRLKAKMFRFVYRDIELRIIEV
jgi:hypothetical protein